MSTPTIKAEFKGRIMKDEGLKVALAKANGDLKMSTIDRWLREDDERLTTYRNLEILKTHFGVLEAEELLEGISVGEADVATR